MLYTGACATLNLKIRLRYIACRILKTQVVAFRDRTTTKLKGDSFELDCFQFGSAPFFLGQNPGGTPGKKNPILRPHPVQRCLFQARSVKCCPVPRSNFVEVKYHFLHGKIA